MKAIGTDAGYRVDHPTMAMVLRYMRIPNADPGPGDTIPASGITTTPRRGAPHHSGNGPDDRLCRAGVRYPRPGSGPGYVERRHRRSPR